MRCEYNSKPDKRLAPSGTKFIQGTAAVRQEGAEFRERMMMRKMKFQLVLAFAALFFAALPAMAQETAKIHGHAQDPTGLPLANGIVTLSSDGGKTAKYTFKTDAGGNYTGDGIAPGTYILIYRNPDTPADKVVDEFPDVKLTAGADTLQDFDMTRAEYIKKLTPDQQKQIEEFKKKNAEVSKENSVIQNLNGDLKTARQDNHDKNYADAETLMTKDTTAKPDAGVLWVELGIAQKGLKKYDDAVVSLKKAIDLDAAGKKPNGDLEGSAGDSLGESLARSGKLPEAQAAYDAAAKANPASAGVYYQNEAIVFSQIGQGDLTIAAADKAIAADPNRAIPYYLKGQSLIAKATVDPKTNKIIAPPGCVEAYQKYLEVAPTGQFAAEVKCLLTEMGATQETGFKSGKKH
jgi:tetratricopeptide (TPR) repeat protein